MRRWSATRSIRSFKYLEAIAVTTLFTAILLAVAERYVASVVALLCGIAMLSYLSERESGHEG